MDLTRTRAEACEQMSEKAFEKLVYATMRYMVFIIMNKVEKFASSAFSYLVFVHNQSDSFSLALFLLIIRFSIPFQLQPNDQLWFLSSLFFVFVCVIVMISDFLRYNEVVPTCVDLYHVQWVSSRILYQILIAIHWWKWICMYMLIGKLNRIHFDSRKISTSLYLSLFGLRE